MNRLWVRLTLAFVAITLLGVVSVAVLADELASQAFRQYVARQDIVVQSGLLDDLAIYYQRQGNWQGVESILSSAPGSGAGRGGRGQSVLLLADSRGQIVYDERATRTGGMLTTDERANALPVVVNDRTVGYLVVSATTSGNLPPAAQTFLGQLRTTLLVVALAVSGLGILLGLLISRALTTPLSKLARAARAFAARDWDHRVNVGGTKEIAEVGRAFNEMAAEIQRTETLRRNLVADIAHELRTPLTVMQGSLQALLDEVYPLERSEIATLYDEARLLTRLVDDLRELSLADAGQLPLQLQSVEVAPILHAVAAQFALAAEAQGVQLDVQVGGPLPSVRADPDRLAQVVRNLLTNALRHTPGGGKIQLAAEYQETMSISVSDTGEGIAAEHVAHVFERFYRADPSRARVHGSTGLGLAICKAWVEAMGGTICLTSVVGQGSRFWFTLPLVKHAENQGS
ncbi:MAG: ATP-binding protein [Ktedonobacteraceae bacterium]